MRLTIVAETTRTTAHVPTGIAENAISRPPAAANATVSMTVVTERHRSSTVSQPKRKLDLKREDVVIRRHLKHQAESGDRDPDDDDGLVGHRSEREHDREAAERQEVTESE